MKAQVLCIKLVQLPTVSIKLELCIPKQHIFFFTEEKEISLYAVIA